MAAYLSRQDLVRLAWGHRGEPAKFDPKPLFAEIKAGAGEEGRHLSRALPRLWKHLDHQTYDGMQFARVTGLSAESFEALMSILSRGRGKTLLDYRFPASPAAMMFVALSVGRFGLRYHGGTLAAKPEGFWYPPHISLGFARAWPNHLGLELYEGLVDSLMDEPPRGLLDATPTTVGLIDFSREAYGDEPNAPYGGGDGTNTGSADDQARLILERAKQAFASAGDLPLPVVSREASAEEVARALAVLTEATGWDGSSSARPVMGPAAPAPAVTLQVMAAVMVVGAHLRREHLVSSGHEWSRAKLIMALAAIWPAGLDIGIFDQLMDKLYERPDFDEHIVGLIG